jgi:cbb3-type cytochrome oxidase subunit 3
MGSVLPIVSLIFFLALFLGVVLWLLLTKRSRWEADARIPLDDGPDPVTPREPRRQRASENRHE